MKMEQIKKKLLFLGGQSLMCQVVQMAQSMGIYAIVADFHADFHLSPAKKIADEAWTVSWQDYDILEKRCRESGVAGVFAGFSEFRVAAARILCDRLGLPFYAQAEQIETTRDKYKFKSVCRACGVPTVEEYELSADLLPQELAKIQYPVVIKPTDNAGSRGISVAYTEAELRAAVEKALSFSESRSLIAERYMDFPEVNITYTLQNGEISLSCMSDAIAGAQGYGQIKLTDGWLFPSRHLQAYVDGADARVRDMIRALGLQNGILFITAFFDGERFFIFEAGFRLGGGTTYNFIEYNNGINYLKMMLLHSLTGEMGGGNARESDNPFFAHPCCNLTVMARPGVLAHIGDVQAIRDLPFVLSLDQMYFEGDEIPDSGALSQTFARVNVVADTAQELAARIRQIYEMLDLRDAQGADMLLSRLDEAFVANYWKK